jgi:hypothetical protein
MISKNIIGSKKKIPHIQYLLKFTVTLRLEGRKDHQKTYSTVLITLQTKVKNVLPQAGIEHIISVHHHHQLFQ